MRAYADASGWSAAAYIARSALVEPGAPPTQAVAEWRATALRLLMRTFRQVQGAATNANQIAAAVNRVMLEHSQQPAGAGALAELVAAVEDLPAVIVALRRSAARVDAVVAQVVRER